MSGKEKLNEEPSALEAALSSLKPGASVVDRDRVMFLAGRASAGTCSPPGRRGPVAWLWPTATAASLLAAVTFGSMLLTRDRSQAVEKVAHTEPAVQDEDQLIVEGRPAGDGIVMKKLQTDYLKLRRLVLAEGVDALPELKPAGTPDAEIPKWEPGRYDNLEQLL